MGKTVVLRHTENVKKKKTNNTKTFETQVRALKTSILRIFLAPENGKRENSNCKQNW